ncbi:hypothetical protein ACC754_36975, partial [Rhizobium johnstonii]
VSGADSMALPVWQAEASSADDRWWLQRLSPGKDGGRERRDGVIFTADPKPVTEIMVEGKAELLAGLHQAEHDIARNTAILAHCATGDLPLRDKRP